MAANWLGLDLNAYASVSLPYTDTKDIPSWDLNAVKALYELGIMQGSRANDGTLRANARASITRAEAMTFQMPAEDVTIRAQYRSAEIIEDAAPSPLATAATIAVGGAAAGIVVWQGVNLGVDLYLANALPQGVPVPTDRRALALLLWETAGKPEVALPTLYGDIPAEEIELQRPPAGRSRTA